MPTPSPPLPPARTGYQGGNQETTRLQWDRHSGGANYNFFDGHSKWFRLEQTLNPDNYLYGDKWYPSFNCPYNKCCK